MNKFGRNYVLKVGTASGETLTIEPPLTIEFDITRNTLTSANVCQIRIYNLSTRNRNQLRFNISNYGTFRQVVLKAGYGGSLATIFSGNISQAWSVREGVNFITQIECYDGGFAFVNGSTNTQFPSGVPQKTIIETLIETLPHVDSGVVGSYPGVTARGNAYSGNTVSILQQLTGGGFFVDNGKANALGTNEYIGSTGGIVLINAKSGLLGTPVLESNIVHFDMLFEPNLTVGSLINLQSATESNFNGQYKVTAVKHRGMISEAVCGSVITTGEFLNVQPGVGVF